MRRRLAFAAVFQRLSFVSFTLFLFRLQGVEPLKDAVVAPPSWKVSRPDRSSDAFKRFALCFQIGLSVVVGGVEADVAKPASDHRDVDACRNQMHSGSVPKAVRRDGLRRQSRCLLRSSSGVLGELEAYTRGAKWSAIAVDEESFVVSPRLTFQ